MPAALTVVAETGEHYRSFGPYVPSINDRGEVAFYAELVSGEQVVVSGEHHIAAAATSHPDVNDAGQVCYFTGRAVMRDGEQLAALGERFAAIGPLGPTMNQRGDIAFRAQQARGSQGLFLARGDQITALAYTGGDYTGFQGLPVVTGGGQVVFRADSADGSAGVFVHDGRAPSLRVRTGQQFAQLGRFPCADDHGAIAFNAVLASGTAGAFVVRDGGLSTLADTGDGFVGFRGALIANNGATAFFATPEGGAMGIYAAPSHRLLGIGDEGLGSTVTAFVLNPVSINSAGMIAVRLELADGRGAIARLRLPTPASLRG